LYDDDADKNDDAADADADSSILESNVLKHRPEQGWRQAREGFCSVAPVGGLAAAPPRTRPRIEHNDPWGHKQRRKYTIKQTLCDHTSPRQTKATMRRKPGIYVYNYSIITDVLPAQLAGSQQGKLGCK
jgi:hypothetical protein